MKKMNPKRFVIGERVRYVNHVMGWDLGMLEVTRLEPGYVIASPYFNHDKEFKFVETGQASWTSNLSITKIE